MNQIISYRDYIQEEERYSINNISGEVKLEQGGITLPRRYERCFFCGELLKPVYDKYSVSLKIDIFVEVDECPRCGWWIGHTKLKEKLAYEQFCVEDIYNGIVKNYDIDDRMLPLNVLNDELKRNPHALNLVNPYKLEEIVQEVLRDFFPCEVKLVGGTGDGGVDLIVVESDNPILVQVKRRENPDKVEIIKGIREFIGTLYIEGKTKGIYVTTAKRYSRGCEHIRKRLLDEKKLEYFELIDFDKLISMLHLDKVDAPWSFFEKNFI